MIQRIIEDLSKNAKELGFVILPNMIYFDDSRSWSLYTHGHIVGANVGKFGAYRNYHGGGVRDAIQHNGREQDGTAELGQLFQDALLQIEAFINEDCTDVNPWDKPTGVLL